MTAPTKRPRRTKKVPPGTMKTWNLASMTADDVEDLRASLNFMADRDTAMSALRAFRAQCEADGKDAFELLAYVVAYNEAVRKGTKRGKLKGADRVKANAKERHIEIAKQLKEADGDITAVAIDRQLSDKPASSERTLRRVKFRPKD